MIGYEIYQWLKRENIKANYPELLLEIDYLDRPGARLLEYLRKGDKVILIDAMKAGYEVGAVKVIDKEVLQKNKLISSHGFGVADTLALAEVIDELPEELTILGIEIGGEEKPVFGEVIKGVKQALQRALR